MQRPAVVGPIHTPGKLIRHSHAILFAEGYTFVRIGHVRVGADDFTPTSIILRRRRRRLRRTFLTPGARAFPDFRSRLYDDTPYVPGRRVRRGRQETRTYVLRVREPTSAQ